MREDDAADDRAPAERTLTNAERDLQLMIDSIPALAWSALPDGTVDFFNSHYLGYVGLSPVQMRDRQWKSVVHPDDLEVVDAAWKSLSAAQSDGEIEARLLRHDGQYRWFSFRTNPFLDNSGAVVRWYGINIDIEDRKRATRLLAGERQLLEMIAWGRPLRDVLEALCKVVEEAAPECYCDIHAVDLTKCLIEYSVAPSLPHSYTDPIAGTPLDGTKLPCGIAVSQKAQVIAEDMESDPRWYHSPVRIHVLRHGLRAVWSTPICSKDGVVLGTLCIVQRQSSRPSEHHQDVISRATNIASIAIERLRAEDELRRREHYLKAGERTSLTGSFTWDMNTDKIEFSDQLRHIYELNDDADITADNVRKRIHPDDECVLNEQIAQIRRGCTDIEFEVRLVMPDGRIKFTHAFASVFQHPDGGLECIGAVQDVTRRRTAEDALANARAELTHVTRVMSLGALTAAIAHEVNQPLSGIVTNASTCLRMLAANPPDIEGARETARRSLRDGNRASEVITRLRGLVQKKDRAVERVDLNELSREVLALAAPELQRRGIVAQSSFDIDLKPILGDRVQLLQVVLNLILNAADALVPVKERPRRIQLRTSQDVAGRVRLTVSDTGQGVEPTDIEKIFDAFYTTKPDGMGIGLSVSRSILERHNGRLFVDTHEGPGASFSFSIPIADTNDVG
ncbi:PAS domain S-box-containing protein [Rhizobium tibeticum]|uniref:GAF domain-containing sensor histidine kinase n=1 Tax=Rhizobium tibeticum TaxID=501024 RepID=UPI00277F1B24|nr:PAS domain-containing protein [Rhizobium tibeticum]MDP9811514.1 PAS domain S-box-containing protein [Rhizobium tibeticum]